MKKYLALSTALAVTLGLAACGTRDEAPANDTTTDAATTVDVDVEDDADAVTAPTSGRGATADELVAGMSADGAWVFGFADDITVDGALNIDGDIEMHSSSTGWTGEIGRKIGLYSRDAERNPIGAFDLTVADGITINSPAMRFLAEGDYIANVNADITVNSADLWLQNIQVNGNIEFASQDLLDSVQVTRWDADSETYVDVELSEVVTGEITVAE